MLDFGFMLANNANKYHSLPATVEEEENQISSEPICSS